MIVHDEAFPSDKKMTKLSNCEGKTGRKCGLSSPCRAGTFELAEQPLVTCVPQIQAEHEARRSHSQIHQYERGRRTGTQAQKKVFPKAVMTTHQAYLGQSFTPSRHQVIQRIVAITNALRKLFNFSLSIHTQKTLWRGRRNSTRLANNKRTCM